MLNFPNKNRRIDSTLGAQLLKEIQDVNPRCCVTTVSGLTQVMTFQIVFVFLFLSYLP